MLFSLAKRFLTTASPRCLWSYGWNFAWNGFWSMRRFRSACARAERTGERPDPPFLFLSLTTRCPYRCQGCWVSADRSPQDMDPALLEHLIASQKRMGSRFFGLLGGEPLLYAGLDELFARHRDCIFQLFTNGLGLTAERARRWAACGNVLPLISLEGDLDSADERRGASEVYRQAEEAVVHCAKAGLITGVATSICRSNREAWVSEAFLKRLIAMGALYVWYYIYRPVGPRPHPELALSAAEVLELRRFMVEQRGRHPLAIVDSYWDEHGRAFCPAARGLSIHITPQGEVEPCPPVQLSGDRLTPASDLYGTIRRSQALAHFGEAARHCGGGCLLMDAPERLTALLDEAGVEATSGRDARREWGGLERTASHHQPGAEIPERHWLYRWAKRYAFFGWGAYG